jgi:hypothetical protein
MRQATHTHLQCRACSAHTHSTATHLLLMRSLRRASACWWRDAYAVLERPLSLLPPPERVRRERVESASGSSSPEAPADCWAAACCRWPSMACCSGARLACSSGGTAVRACAGCCAHPRGGVVRVGVITWRGTATDSPLCTRRTTMWVGHVPGRSRDMSLNSPPSKLAGKQSERAAGVCSALPHQISGLNSLCFANMR